MRELLPWGGHHLYDRFVGRSLARFYAGLVPDLPQGDVLDVGCGPGHLAAAMAGAGRVVTAVDKDPVQVRIAHRNHPGFDVREGDAAALAFPDDHFDGIVTSESFHHWSDPERGLQEAHRVLRPGGRMVIIETCGDITKRELAEWTRWVPPGWIHIVRWIFREHGYTTQALHSRLLPLVRAEFGVVDVERRMGWWIVSAGDT